MGKDGERDRERGREREGEGESGRDGEEEREGERGSDFGVNRGVSDCSARELQASVVGEWRETRQFCLSQAMISCAVAVGEAGS